MFSLRELLTKKLKFDIFLFGVVLFSIIALWNTSQFGASLSWILIPCCVIIVGLFFKSPVRVVGSRLLIILLLLIYVLSTLFSSYVSVERNLVTFAILCLIYICVTSQHFSFQHIRILIMTLIISSTVASLCIIYNWLVGDYYVAWFARSSLKVLGVYKDPNYVMSYIVPAIYICFYWLISAKKRRIIPLILIAVMMVACLATGSRSALVAIVLSIFVMLLFYNAVSISTKIKFLVAGGVLGVIAVIVAISVLPQQSIDRLFNFSDETRMTLWRSALSVFVDSPIWGGGMSAASTVALQQAGNNSHNVYLDILCDSGILGAIAFVVFFIVNCCRATRRNRSFLYGAIVAFMLPLFFINGFNTASFYLPLIVLTILSTHFKETGMDPARFFCPEKKTEKN